AFCKTFLPGTTPLISQALAHVPCQGSSPLQKPAAQRLPFRRESTAIAQWTNQGISSRYSAAAARVRSMPPKCAPSISTQVQTSLTQLMTKTFKGLQSTPPSLGMNVFLHGIRLANRQTKSVFAFYSRCTQG